MMIKKKTLGILFSKIIKSFMKLPKHTCTEIHGALKEVFSVVMILVKV